MRRTRNPKFMRIDLKGASGQIREIYSGLIFFYSDLFLFPDSPTEAIRGRIFTRSVSNYVQSRKEVPFWGLHDGLKHLGGLIPPKPSKLGVNMLCRASQLRVNED